MHLPYLQIGTSVREDHTLKLHCVFYTEHLQNLKYRIETQTKDPADNTPVSCDSRDFKQTSDIRLAYAVFAFIFHFPHHFKLLTGLFGKLSSDFKIQPLFRRFSRRTDYWNRLLEEGAGRLSNEQRSLRYISFGDAPLVVSFGWFLG